ncbi:hypothetical protein GF380_05350 [Candidatus Uhrbacteria bacterium]|nr:hypothetical protein [Candidatus Uhrbacteria bacterium]MBD3284456.1 hypothetical protein [Candidatus Uhrbacteria bacterium]
MNPILRIILGLGIAVIGAYFVIKTRNIHGFIGPMDWAERKLGGGSSYFLYKMIGIAVALIGFIVAANLWNEFLNATLGSIIPRG